jgi:hypothetical protein
VKPTSCSQWNGGFYLIKWRKLQGDDDATPPIVQRVMITNGSCKPGIAPKTKIGTGGVGTPCTPIDKKDLSINIDTTKGNCVATAEYPKKTFLVSGNIVLSGDRVITSDIVEFEPSSSVITNGHNLQISAPEVKVDQGASILGYDRKGNPLPPGSDGVSGGSVVLKSRSLDGDGDLTIDLSGQNGEAGVKGEDGGPGGKGPNAQPRGWHGLKGCLGGAAGGRGQTGGAGQNGTLGGNGGDGGLVAVQIEGGATDADVSRLIIAGTNGMTAGGKGASGGAGGVGGPGGPGGSSAAGHQGCGTQPGGPQGFAGPNGAAGSNGVDGKNGIITIQ